MSDRIYDRTGQDVGNIIALEHVNVCVPDMELAALFYVHGLGLTRDPYLDLGPDLLWVNVGEQQFHLPLGDPQVVRGTIELVVPDLIALRHRLEGLAHRLSGTRFEIRAVDDHLEVRGPWGNRFVCRQARAGRRMTLGLPAVELSVPAGTAEGIGRFYTRVIGAPATVVDGVCQVGVGPDQSLRFREVDGSDDEVVPTYDGHHLAVYVADFSGPHARLLDQDRIVEESDEHQYRFTQIADPVSGRLLFELEHEVRSLAHPLYRRPLINRNAEQRIPTYTPGADPYHPGVRAAGEASWAEVRAVLNTVG